ncbi:MAG: hypothetical protein RSA29_17090 [Clostridium sp.]|uniref:hypothetical protein n=1 Tax=Clostridium sp. TaxID=1506 RepID=UPI0030431150
MIDNYILETISDFNISGASQVEYNNVHFGFGERQKELQEEMCRINQEKYEREVENNESLKSLVDYNHEISNYNKELVSLNEKILNKINSLDDTLLFLNNVFDKKAYSDKTLAQGHNALLLELITIIESQDPTKLQQFMSGVAAPVGVGLIVEYFKMKLGLTGM